MVRFAAAAIALLTSLIGLSAFGSEITLLEFSTPSCGYCQQMEPLIQTFIKAKYPIRKVDATVEPQVAQQYGVSRFPTFIMLVDGHEITRHEGAMGSEQLQQLFAQARQVVMDHQPSNPAPSVAPRPPELSAQRETTPRSAPPSAPPPIQSLDPSFASLISSTVRLRVEDPDGRSSGTGTIIDARQGEALVITCGHLFRESKGKGPVSVELFEAVDGVVRPAGQVSGWVLSFDLDREVALVVIRTSRPVTAAPIAPPGSRIERGDRVVSIGCSNGQDPTALPARVTTLDRYKGAPNIEVSGAPVEGRSGGGLFNDKGELVGVCYAADYPANEGLYAALQTIHDQIARLDMLPKKDDLAPKVSGPIADSSRDRLAGIKPPFALGQNDPPNDLPKQDQITPIATTTTIGPNSLPTTRPAGLSPTEQAAWEEISKRSADHELIVIVRPKEPGGQSEVIMLDNISPEFIKALEARKHDPQAPIAR